MRDVYVGLDIGTTQTKAVAYSENEEVLYTSYASYSLQQGKGGQVEEKVSHLLKACQKCLQEVYQKFPQRIVSVSFACAMHGLLLMSKTGDVLTNLLTFADTRSKKITAEIKASSEGVSFFQKTGLPVHPMGPIYKIKYLQQKHPELTEKAFYYLGFKEYLWFLLTGKLWTDYGSSAAFGVLNCRSFTHEESVLNWLQLTSENLPELHEATDFLIPEANSYFPFLDGKVSFYLGSTDGYLANLGLVEEHLAAPVLTMGTSGAIRVISQALPETLASETFAYGVKKGCWLIGGASSNAGSSLQWGKDLLFSEIALSELVTPDLLKKMPSLFLPYLLGERAPLWRPEASAAFLGLTYSAKKEDLFLSVILGILFNMREILVKVEKATGPISEILANGGFFASPLLRQLTSDVLGKTLIFQENPEASALGAVRLSHPRVKKELKKITITPQENEVKKYAAAFQLYQEAKKTYTSLFVTLENWQELFKPQEN